MGRYPIIFVMTWSLVCYPVIAIDFDDLPSGMALLQGLLPYGTNAPTAQIERWQDEFVATMTDLL